MKDARTEFFVDGSTGGPDAAADPSGDFAVASVFAELDAKLLGGFAPIEPLPLHSPTSSATESRPPGTGPIEARLSSMNAQELFVFFMSVEWERYSSINGVVDLEKVEAAPELRSATGGAFPRFLEAVSVMRDTQLEHRRELRGLSFQERDMLFTVLSGLTRSPDVIADTPTGRAIVRDAISKWGAGGREIVCAIAGKFSHIPAAAPPGKLLSAVESFLAMVLTTGDYVPRGSPELTQRWLAEFPLDPSRPN